MINGKRIMESFKFKEGDHVIVINDDMYRLLSNGDEGVVVGILPATRVYRIKITKSKKECLSEYVVRENEIAKINTGFLRFLKRFLRYENK